MDAVEILQLMKYGEHIHLECKKAEAKLPASVWETYSSFANTDGGVILLGVDENVHEQEYGKRFSLSAISNPQQRITDFWNTVNSDKVSVNIMSDDDIGICSIDGVDLIWIHVPRADYRQRPVYINGNILKGSFKRNHEGDYCCTKEEVKAMLRDAADSGNDGSELVGYTMNDIDLPTLRSYRIEFEHHNPDHVWNGTDDLTFLKYLGGYSIDRVTGKGWLTTAGLLMFGTGLAVRERFDQIRMDYLDVSNLLPGSRWSDRLTYDGRWENNLYNFLRQVVPRLVSGLKRPFTMTGMIRTDDTPVHKAIREAVINMMIHSDYMIGGVLKIEKSDFGFSFSNPGSLKLPIEMIYEGGHSSARNPRIQTMFRMIGYGDNIGSGIPTILQAWGQENWRKPDLSQSEEAHEVNLKLWMISLLPPECVDYLHRLYGQAYDSLDHASRLILATSHLEGVVTNARMQSILGLQGYEIGRYLSDLVDRQMLVVDRNGRWTSYRINDGYTDRPVQVSVDDVLGCEPEFTNHSERMIYRFIKENGFITSAQACQITGLTTRQGASAALNRMIHRGLLRMVRKGKSTYYELL